MSSDNNASTNNAIVPEGVPLHTMDIVVKWGDMDAMGHVNNANYFRFFEQVRLTWYHESGCGVLGNTNDGFVIVNNFAEYLRPVTWPSTVTVRMAGHSPGRSSFMSTYTLSVNDEIYTKAYAKVVWIDTVKNTSIPLPDSVVKQLNP